MPNYNLPELPSSFQNQQPPTPPSASALVVTDATTALTTTNAALTLDLGGPKYVAMDHIPADQVPAVKSWATKMARDKDLDAAFLAADARKLSLDTSILDRVVQNTRALDAGELGRLTIQATHYMDQVTNRVPKNVVDDRFIQRVKAGQIAFKDVVQKVAYISRLIGDALREYQSLADPIAEVRTKLDQKYNLMFEAIVLNQQLAENEDEQAANLTWKAAQLEALFDAIKARVNELNKTLQDPSVDKQAVSAEMTRLNNLAPLVEKALQILKPMIFTGHNAVGRYLQLSNMAGGRAVVLGLFITVGLYRWESDIVTKLQEMNQLASGLVTGNMEDIMNRQAQDSSATYVQAAQSYVDLLTRWSTTQKTLEQIVNDTHQVQQILINGYRNLDAEYGKTSSAVQSAFTAVQKGQEEFNGAFLSQ